MAETKYTFTTNVKIRTGPSTSDSDTGVYNSGDSVIVTETKKDSSGNLWGKTDRGWSCLVYQGENYASAGGTSSSSTSTVTTGGVYKVTLDNGTLTVRSSASTSGTKVGSLNNGDEVTIESLVSNGNEVWGKISSGQFAGNYVCKSQGGSQYLSFGADGDGNVSSSEASQIREERLNSYTQHYDKMASDALEDATNNNTIATDSGFADFYSGLYRTQVKNLNDKIPWTLRMFGAPHQFTEDVDPRIAGTSELGMVFAESLISEAPIVHILPGRTDFLPGKSKDKKDGWISVIADSIKTGDTDGLKEKLTSIFVDDSDVIRYFGFKGDFINYMNKVNMLCRICAHYMGIGNEMVPWHNSRYIKFKNYNWMYYKFNSVYDYSNVRVSNSDSFWQTLKGLVAFDVNTMTSDYDEGDDRWLEFYVDSSASYSESVSNSLGDSVIAQYTDQLSTIGKELQTVTGMSGLDISGLATGITSSLDSFIEKITSGGGAIGTFFQRLTSNANQVLEGANFLIPQVWQDSSFSKSYNFSITLASPYGNPISYYLNILVPIMHILAMALPEQGTANTYKTPNIIKLFSPGWFSCEMGMIDSINIDKGSDNGWAISKLPTEVKVSIGVRDLYSSLGIPTIDDEKSPAAAVNLMTNTGLTDYLLTISGVDLTDPEVGRQFSIIRNLYIDEIYDKATSFAFKVRNTVQDVLTSISSVF